MDEPIVRKWFERDECKTIPVGESRTRQSFADESNINVIMERYRQTGIVEHVNKVQGRYGDYSVVPSYQEAMEKIKRAHDMFMTLPSDIRAKFQNDPGEFLAFASDPKNEEEMIELGLKTREIDPKVPEEKLKAEVVPEEPPAEPSPA